MVLNPFFQQGAKSEQSLVQNLINEQLRMYGVEVHYLPRKYMTETKVIREVVQSVFDDAYPLEAYVDSYDGYGDNPTILTKFGIQATNEITLTISKERFESYISPLIKNESNIKLSTRPKEGDLIYFPLGDRLFEIKYVEHEKPFYQLQKNYVYELRCELFRYGDEVIDTGVDAIDDELTGDSSTGITDEDGISTILGSSQTLTVVGTGATAWGYTGFVDGALTRVVMTNRGGGYIYAPHVRFGSAPSGGITGIGSAYLLGGIVACNKNLNSNEKVVQEVRIVNAGAGYTIAPGIGFTNVVGSNGTGAAATAYIGNGVLGIVTITNGGSGFATDNPVVTFSAPAAAATGLGTTATGYGVVSAGGTIISVNYTNTGAGYTAGDLPISVTFDSPSMNSTGNFIFNEIVTGSVSSTTARVRSWDSTTNILEVSSVGGVFVIGEMITGSTSGATHELRLIDLDPPDDGYADNFNIETEADKILDFTEANPFGTP